MREGEIRSLIEGLVEEEHRLWSLGAQGLATPGDRLRIHSVRVELERLWDLLRQRRALASAGLDPDVGRLRDPDTIRGYLQ